ncbi:hypothetical protein BC936DRAFT_143209 [Jimgerdemannia flammicorona]|uniref:Uncharacterized protein n=1 Tax=Jimgerdemannia flammicorona TaxID=994334 RepID=A0A432ZZ95_9FUNG|nr:hypothetical protein BC936DRAFT_143209 [Jimgerdemannia flammicorona]
MTLEFLKIYCNSLPVSFKNLRNIIQKLQKEAILADQTTIITALSLLKKRCVNYSLERIYNMDETGLFYQ